MPGHAKRFVTVIYAIRHMSLTDAVAFFCVTLCLCCISHTALYAYYFLRPKKKKIDIPSTKRIAYSMFDCDCAMHHAILQQACPINVTFSIDDPNCLVLISSLMVVI